ncbi:Zinc finger protein ZPR1 [Nymphon striatum]|nr:Zinc finger protein ZPR1 [Nymphon striatum]
MEEANLSDTFKDLQVDEDPAANITEIESLCMNCHEDGMTKLLLAKIPYYKEVIVSSFACEKCGFTNSGIQSGAVIQEKGVLYDLRVTKTDDLNRQVVKSDYCAIKIPEIRLEIPPTTQPGEITTIEGVIDRVSRGITEKLAHAISEDDMVSKLSAFLTQLNDLKNVSKPFHFIVEDASGNCYIENPLAPKIDPEISISYFERTHKQDVMLGLSEEDDNNKDEKVTENEPINTEEDVLEFPVNCYQCNVPATTKMKITKIPHFKEVIIMATTCDSCGYRTNEVKSGSGIEPMGKRTELEIIHLSDLSRDVLKSETCTIIIPEIELEVGMAALGGRFTTVEGILCNIKDQLGSENPFFFGDSANPCSTEKFKTFLEKIDKIKDGELSVHFILDDPCGNSYIQNLYAPEDDPKMKIISYERSFDQNEELGLNDMKTEGYEVENDS